MFVRLVLGLLILTSFTGCRRETKSVEDVSEKPAGPSVQKDMTADDLYKLAEQVNRSGNYFQAIEILNKAFELDPENRLVIVELMKNYQNLASDGRVRVDKESTLEIYYKVAELGRKLAGSNVELSVQERSLIGSAFYNEACAFSIQAQKDKALASLNDAVVMGFDQVGLIETDIDLALIRRDARFNKSLAIAIATERRKARVEVDKMIETMTPFPIDFSLPDQDGRLVKLSEIKREVTILQISGTWCGPGLQQNPQLTLLSKSEDLKWLAVVGVYYEDGTPDVVHDRIRKFMSKSKLPFPVLVGDDALLKSIPEFQGYPTTLILDAQGRARARLLGYHDRHALAEFAEAVRAAGSAAPAEPESR